MESRKKVSLKCRCLDDCSHSKAGASRQRSDVRLFLRPAGMPRRHSISAGGVQAPARYPRAGTHPVAKGSPIQVWPSQSRREQGKSQSCARLCLPAGKALSRPVFLPEDDSLRVTRAAGSRLIQPPTAPEARHAKPENRQHPERTPTPCESPAHDSPRGRGRSRRHITRRRPRWAIHRGASSAPTP